MFGANEDDVEFGLHKLKLLQKKWAPGIEGKAGLMNFNTNDDDL